MNRMDNVFGRLSEENKNILILYFPIGDTIFDDDISWAGKYFDGGCTVLEIGLPNDNPVLDGKTVSDSMARALSHTNLEEIFVTIEKMRKKYPENILQIMTYYHIIDGYGIEEFARKCDACGVDGVLCPNTPADKVAELDQALGAYNVYNLRFVPYHLTDEVIRDLKENSHGYIFQQAVDGGTGAQPTVSPQIGKNVKLIKEAGVKTPVCAGFGISDAAQAAEAISMGADGVIVGSATITHILAGDGEEFIASLGNAMKS